MKKLIIRIAFFVVLGIAGYFAYQFYSFQNQDVWQLIPDDAFAIIEVDDITNEWEEIEKSSIMNLTKNLKFSKATKEELARIDSVLQAQGNSIDELLAGKKLTFSMHQKLDGSFATLIYIPMERQDIDMLETINRDYKSNSETCKTINFENKWYMGYTQNNYTVYAYNFKSVVLLSSSEEMIKKAIVRTTKIDENAAILENKRFHELHEADNSKVTAYLNITSFFKGLKPYFKEESHALIDALARFEDNAFLDVSLSEKGLELSGFSHAKDAQNSFLTSFNGQSPDKIFLQNFISLRTVLLNFWHIDNGSEFELNLTNYWQNTDVDLLNERQELVKNYNIQLAQLNQHIQGQIAYAMLSNSVSDLDKIALAQVDNLEEVQALLNDFAYKMSTGDLQKSNYHGDDIVKLELYDFPALMMGEYFQGFDQTYYCLKDGFLMMSDSDVALKQYLDDLEGGKVWSRSLKHSVFVEEQLVSSNLGFYADTESLKTFFKKNLDDKGQEYYTEYAAQIDQLDNVLIQISTDTQNKFYTDLIVEFKGGVVEDVDEEIIAEQVEEAEFKELFSVSFDTTIVTKPILVKNYKTKTLDILVQTADYKLYNVSKRGEILWSYQLDTTMLSDAFELDYYTNGKLQYLFATHKSVYLLDRLGNIVEGYPFSLPDSNNIESLALFDYDNNRNYRLLATDGSGLMFLFNKEGKNLGGWSPLELTSSIVEPPRHLRVRGKDFILAVEKAGKVNLFNRRGEKIKGFPIDIGEECVGSVFVDLGNSFSNSFIKIVSKSGKITSINLAGNSSEDDFWMEGDAPSLLLEAAEHDYILRNKVGKEDLFFKSGRQDLFSQDYTNQNAQYYRFDNKPMIVLSGGTTDQLQMIVDGKNVAPEGLMSGNEVGILYSKRRNIFQVYSTYQNQLHLVQFDGLRE